MRFYRGPRHARNQVRLLQTQEPTCYHTVGAKQATQRLHPSIKAGLTLLHRYDPETLQECEALLTHLVQYPRGNPSPTTGVLTVVRLGCWGVRAVNIFPEPYEIVLLITSDPYILTIGI